MLQGKAALITGSLDGIGFAIAQALARQGCAVMLNGFGDDKLIRERVQTLRDTGAAADYHGADLSVPAQIEAMVEATTRRFGGADIAINNAVTRTWGNIDELAVDRWNYALAVNLSAPFHVIRLTMPGMKKKRWGRIINLASNYGLAGTARRVDYVSTKHGLVGMTKGRSSGRTAVQHHGERHLSGGHTYAQCAQAGDATHGEQRLVRGGRDH